MDEENYFCLPIDEGFESRITPNFKRQKIEEDLSPDEPDPNKVRGKIIKPDDAKMNSLKQKPDGPASKSKAIVQNEIQLNDTFYSFEEEALVKPSD